MGGFGTNLLRPRLNQNPVLWGPGVPCHPQRVHPPSWLPLPQPSPFSVCSTNIHLIALLCARCLIRPCGSRVSKLDVLPAPGEQLGGVGTDK